jgi:cobalamin biosynthesis protein CobD/CbiB
MRSVELARAAAQAEALYLRRVARRQAMRGAFGAVAAVFGIAIVVMLHVLLYVILAGFMQPAVAALIVLAVDLVMAIVFAVLARRNAPDRIEEEARLLRDEALAGLRSSLTMTSLAASAAGLVLRRGASRTKGRGRRVIVSALASRLMPRR